MSDKRTILLVEDDVFIRDIYSLRFTQDSFKVVALENGLNALEKLQQGLSPDIILLDIMMPGMDGIEVLRRIKNDEKFKNIPVLMLTNISEKEKILESKKMGAADYLIKSYFTPSEVVQKVEALLER